MPNNHKNDVDVKEMRNPDSARRVSGYTSEANQKSWWDVELVRVRKLEKLPRGTGMGLLLGRVADFKLKLDLRSLEKANGGPLEPGELTHKPRRRPKAKTASSS